MWLWLLYSAGAVSLLLFINTIWNLIDSLKIRIPKEGETERVRSLDAAWVAMDQPYNLMVVTGVFFFKDGNVNVDDIRDRYRTCILGYPQFRRLRQFPTNLHLYGPLWRQLLDPRNWVKFPFWGPVWTFDENFDVTYHITDHDLWDFFRTHVKPSLEKRLKKLEAGSPSFKPQSKPSNQSPSSSKLDSKIEDEDFVLVNPSPSSSPAPSQQQQKQQQKNKKKSSDDKSGKSFIYKDDEFPSLLEEAEEDEFSVLNYTEADGPLAERRVLQAVISYITVIPLDPKRPLWHNYVFHCRYSHSPRNNNNDVLEDSIASMAANTEEHPTTVMITRCHHGIGDGNSLVKYVLTITAPLDDKKQQDQQAVEKASSISTSDKNQLRSRKKEAPSSDSSSSSSGADSADAKDSQQQQKPQRRSGGGRRGGGKGKLWEMLKGSLLFWLQVPLSWLRLCVVVRDPPSFLLPYRLPKQLPIDSQVVKFQQSIVQQEQADLLIQQEEKEDKPQKQFKKSGSSSSQIRTIRRSSSLGGEAISSNNNNNNNWLTGHKIGAWTVPTFKVEEVKEVGQAFNATINDVMAAAISLGLHYYAKEFHLPNPTSSSSSTASTLSSSALMNVMPEVKAFVPVGNAFAASSSKSNEHLELRNNFGFLFLPLPLNCSDPVESLKQVQKQSSKLKHSPIWFVSYLLMAFFGAITSPLYLKLSTFFWTSQASLVFTNVKGPDVPLQLGGWEVEDLCFFVPQAGGIGLGVSVFSYNGEITLAIYADSAIIPTAKRADRLMWHFRQGFEMLKQKTEGKRK